MEVFTYAKKAPALRNQVAMLMAVLMGDVVVFLVAGFVVPGWWKGLVLGGGAALVAYAFWKVGEPLRTAHRLDGAAFHLQMGRFALSIPREVVQRASLYTEGLPRGLELPTRPCGYKPELDTLYLLADRKGLVLLELNRVLEARTRRLGLLPFTRLVLSVDEPERLVAALGDSDTVVPAPQTPVTGPTAPHLVTEGAAIHLEGLCKRYGDFQAVADVSLSVAPGEILAFLGSNGAGKTTTVKMLTGLLRPSGGRVLLDGRDFWAGGPELRRLVGYVPDVPLLYERLTAREYLWLVGGLYGLERPAARARAEELLTQLGLGRFGDQLVRSFSLGMKRKLAIAAALVHKPRVLVLDEVTNGLDPRAAREVKDLILAAARGGAAVFLTTHLLDVVQELADRIALIDRGRLRAVGTVDELRAGVGVGPTAGLEALFLAYTAPEAGVGA